jgi:DNA-directed RNA polymerase specialized sigma24 family protein
VKLSPQEDHRREDPARTRVTHSQWELTPEAFAKLLAAFSPNQEQAGQLYLSFHSKLVRFFEWKCCRDAEHLVDVTFNRVARKLCEGQPIENVCAFSRGVAEIVLKETWKQQDRLAPEQAIETIAYESVDDDDIREQRLKCLDECLAKQASENRALVLEYFSQEAKAKEIHDRMATRLGISLNALRIRVHRIRERVEECLELCMTAA